MKADKTPIQKQLIQEHSTPLKTNCAGLAKLLGTSRTSIKRFVDNGLIALDAEGQADIKQASHAILTQSNRVKKNLLKFDDAEKKELLERINSLQSYLVGIQATQAAKVQAFIDLLVTDSTLKKAVKQGNRAILQNAFNNMKELNVSTNYIGG
jgi:hypothetical protein